MNFIKTIANMPHIFCSEHNEDCSMDKKIDWFGYEESTRRFCRPITTVFYHKGNFYIITYNSCINKCSTDADFYQPLFKQLMECKKSKYFENNRTYLEDELRAIVKENALLKRDIKEINQIYTTCFNKTYCIYTDMPYCDYMSYIIDIEDNYKTALSYAKENKMYDIAEQIEELYKANNFYDFCEDKLILKTIDELTKLLKK
jgi:hypothetical protein